MKKLLSLLLSLAIILSTVSFVSAEETGEPKILENFLVMTDQDIANYKKIKRADKKAFEEIKHEIELPNQEFSKEEAMQFILDGLNDSKLTDEEKEKVKEAVEKNSGIEQFVNDNDENILQFINERTSEYNRILANNIIAPRVELGKDINSNISLKNEGKITIQLYDKNGVVKEETVDGTNAKLNYVPDKAGVYKVKYLVNGFVVGVDTITVEDKNNVSLYTKHPEFEADMQAFGFEIIAFSKNYHKKDIRITDIDKYYEFVQELKKNPQLAKAKLMETISIAENFAPSLNTNPKRVAGPLTKYATIEQYKKLVDGIVENADSFIAFYNGETKKDKFTGLSAKQAKQMKEESEKNKETQNQNPGKRYRTFEEVYGNFEQWYANQPEDMKEFFRQWNFGKGDVLQDYYLEDKKGYNPETEEIDTSKRGYSFINPVQHGETAYYRVDGKSYPLFMMRNGIKNINYYAIKLSDGSFSTDFVRNYEDLPPEVRNNGNNTTTPTNTPEPEVTPTPVPEVTPTPTPEVTPENPSTEQPSNPTNTPEPAQPTEEPAQPTQDPGQPTEIPEGTTSND